MDNTIKDKVGIIDYTLICVLIMQRLHLSFLLKKDKNDFKLTIIIQSHVTIAGFGNNPLPLLLLRMCILTSLQSNCE